MHPQVYGRSAHDKAIIRVYSQNAAFSRAQRIEPDKRDRRSFVLEGCIRETFEAAIQLHHYPRSQLDIHILVLQDHGGVTAAAINATTLALIDAGIPLRDFVVACTSGFLDGIPAVDIN